jgi:hypothetical protein
MIVDFNSGNIFCACAHVCTWFYAFMDKACGTRSISLFFKH